MTSRTMEKRRTARVHSYLNTAACLGCGFSVEERPEQYDHAELKALNAAVEDHVATTGHEVYLTRIHRMLWSRR